MRRAWLSEDRSPLARAAAEGLRALGWQVESGGDEAEADLRVYAAGSAQPAPGRGAVVMISDAPDRLGLSELSLQVRKLAVAAAPQGRVNGVAVSEGWAGTLAETIDWLAGADMVTGQLILLSQEPGPTIPF
jgi:hypothetical protein